MPPLLLVMLGGSIGAGARYLFGRAAEDLLGRDFPWGTFGVNVIGGLLIGVLAGTLVRLDAGDELRLLLGVGVLGGFTTFSTFSLELFELIMRGEVALGAAYATASVAGSVVALWVGAMLARSLA